MLQAELYFFWCDSQWALYLTGKLHYPGSRAIGMNDWLFLEKLLCTKFSHQDERLCCSLPSPPSPLFSGRALWMFYAVVPIIVVLIIVVWQPLCGTSLSLVRLYDLNCIVLFLLDKNLVLWFWWPKSLCEHNFCTSRWISSICRASPLITLYFSNKVFLLLPHFLWLL